MTSTSFAPRLSSIALCAALASGLLASGAAMAESTYGYAAAGTGAITATSRVNLAVTVPKLIILRVGTTGTTVDNLTWAVTPTVPGIAALANGSNQASGWTAVAPTIAVAPTAAGSNATTATAWTNTSNATIACAVTGLVAGGPAAADFAVAATGATPLAHPGATLAACATPVAFAAGAVRPSTWTYTLPAAAPTWAAGAYTAVVTYTAQSL